MLIHIDHYTLLAMIVVVALVVSVASYEYVITVETADSCAPSGCNPQTGNDVEMTIKDGKHNL